jgi:hypothetical protein
MEYRDPPQCRHDGCRVRPCWQLVTADRHEWVYKRNIDPKTHRQDRFIDWTCGRHLQEFLADWVCRDGTTVTLTRRVR